MKFTIRDILTQGTTDYYAHFSFFRKGSSTVPLPDPINSNNLRSMSNAPLDYILYFPESSAPYVVEIRICKPAHPREGGWECDTEEITIRPAIGIQAYFLLSNATKAEFSNTSNVKLRRPFIVCDGFDPGNKRDYFRNNIIVDPKMPKDNDTRGLYELINGNSSPWYPNGTAGLMDYLRNDGYDIVVINFLDGAGDIPTNAGINGMRGFLNFLNTNYRDNKTEEIVMIGPSMGGIITRYALTSMEQANPKEEHFVKTWISFDSPQQGAYIPLGLQHAVSFLTKIHTAGITKLEEAQEQFKNAKASLNTIAAKQMLLYHHTATSSQGNPANEFTTLYNQLNTKGYPILSKNYAISNGGKSKLYNSDGSQILDFQITYLPWTYTYANGNHNTAGNYYLYEGSRQGFWNDEEIHTNNQIAYENAPGGWNSALYSLNCNPGNSNKKSDTNIQYTKATFMVSTSAFGVPVTRTNVHNTWEAYTGCSDNTSGKIKTHFDVVHGMVENEEHVRITVDTRIFLMNNVLHPDFDNMQRPVVRAGNPINQVVKGKVAYTAKETITFGGNGNTITFDENSDITVRAGGSIILKPGTTIKAGAKFSAKIENVDYGTTLRSSNTVPTIPIDFSEKSPYFGEISNYSTTGHTNISSNSSFNLYPNPASDRIYFNFAEISTKIEICSLDGKVLIIRNNAGNAGDIDISHLQNGIYIVKVHFSYLVKPFKIIKL